MLDQCKLVGFVPTTNPDAAQAFYRDVLGLKLVVRDDYAITFDANGTTLRVTTVPKLAPHPFTTLGWWVDDPAATVDQLGSNGVIFERIDGMQQDERGLWCPPGSRVAVAWFKDPDGNLLSITGFVAG